MMRSKLKLILISSLLFPSILNAFPEFIRKGYPSCISCHLSPSGGGSLSKYGRMVSAEMFSTWGESSRSWWKDFIYWGGDIRYLYLKNDRVETHFPMQADLEIGVEPVNNLYFVGAAGVYGEDKETEILKAYGMYKIISSKNSAIIGRYGKFYPNYGLMIPDHTKNIRAYHYVSRETLPVNAEVSLIGKWGEISYTNMLGKTDKNESYGLSYGLDNLYGEAAKAALYITKYAQLGYSYMDANNRFSHGPFLAGGYKRFYLLGQIDYQKDFEHHFIESGLEVFKGCSVFGTYQNEDRYSYGLKWYPYRHLEILTEFSENQITSMMHYYF